MEIIQFVPQNCDCVNRIMRFDAERQRIGYSGFGVGSIVTCECKRTWALTQVEDSPTWTQVEEVLKP